MLRFGNITEIDVEKCFARVTFIDDGIVSDWLQICVMGAIGNKYFHMFDVNEQVACLMDENSEEGVVLGALFNEKTNPDGGNKNVVRVKFSDDSSIEYDRSSHEYNIDIKGKVNITAQTEANISALNANITAISIAKIEAPAIQLNGAVAISGALALGGGISGSGGSPISGNLEVTGEIKGSTITDGTISLATHKHSGVQTGPGVSGPAIP